MALRRAPPPTPPLLGPGPPGFGSAWFSEHRAMLPSGQQRPGRRLGRCPRDRFWLLAGDRSRAVPRMCPARCPAWAQQCVPVPSGAGQVLARCFSAFVLCGMGGADDRGEKRLLLGQTEVPRVPRPMVVPRQGWGGADYSPAGSSYQGFGPSKLQAVVAALLCICLTHSSSPARLQPDLREAARAALAESSWNLFSTTQ